MSCAPTTSLASSLLERSGFPDLEARVLRAISRPAASPIPDFDALARDVFQFQFSCNPAYQAFCKARGVTPETLGPDADWTRFPAVPTDVFRVAPLTTFPVSQAVRTFRTSGTTQEARGQHHFLTLSLYRAAMIPPFKRYMLPDGGPLPLVSLIPPPDVLPDASLSYMVGYLASRKDICGGVADFFATREGIASSRVRDTLADMASARQPVMILTTALALKRLLEETPGFRVRLPAGSRMMQTGGVKGLRTAWTHQELLRQVTEMLGIPPSHCVAEYGMTELSSQMYETALRDACTKGDADPGRLDGGAVPAIERPLDGPAWLKWTVVDPVSETPAAEGRPGLIRFFDPANLLSVSAIQTSDIGVRQGDHLWLLGRAAHASPRGCSLTAEALFSDRRRADGS